MKAVLLALLEIIILVTCGFIGLIVFGLTVTIGTEWAIRLWGW